MPQKFYYINPFLANVPILYPLKTPESQRYSDVSRGYKMGTLVRNGLRGLAILFKTLKSSERKYEPTFTYSRRTYAFTDPLDTGRKLNVHKTFRRRPGHLLNVFCMFNIRSVSRGYVIIGLNLTLLNIETILWVLSQKFKL